MNTAADFLLNDVQKRNRGLVKAMGKQYQPDEKMVVGHIFEEDGRYRTYYLKNSFDNIARFILHNEKDKLICDSMDFAILCTIGEYIDICSDDMLLEQLLDVLKKTKRKIEFDCVD